MLVKLEGLIQTKVTASAVKFIGFFDNFVVFDELKCGDFWFFLRDTAWEEKGHEKNNYYWRWICSVH